MIVPCGRDGIEAAARAAAGGGIVIYPTDTVYGIGCDPYNAAAIERIYGIKSREKSRQLPVLVHSVEAAEKLAVFGARARRVAARFWPGPVTMILGLEDVSLRGTMGLQDSIAVRVPDHECALGLLERCGPLTGTSANESGGAPATSAGSCQIECDVLLDGGETGGTESTIADMRGGDARIVREGAVPGGEIGRT